MSQFKIPLPQELNNRIPGRALIVQNQEDSEMFPYRISYLHYNDKECEINNLLKNRGREFTLTSLFY